MIKQPGFLVLSVYTAWTYAQYNLILMVRKPHSDTDCRLTLLALGCLSIDKLPLHSHLCRSLRPSSCPWRYVSLAFPEGIILQSCTKITTANRQFHVVGENELVVALRSASSVHVLLTHQRRCFRGVFAGSATHNCRSLCHGRPCWIHNHDGHG